MAEPPELVTQARKMQDYGAQCVYVADATGAMTPDDVRRRVAALRQALEPEVEVGIHAHSKLRCAL